MSLIMLIYQEPRAQLQTAKLDALLFLYVREMEKRKTEYPWTKGGFCFYGLEFKAIIKFEKLEIVSNILRPVFLKKKISLVYLCSLSTMEALEPFLIISGFLPIHYNSSKRDSLQQNCFPFSSLPFFDLWWLLNLLWHSVWNKLMSFHILSSSFLIKFTCFLSGTIKMSVAAY